MLRLTILILFLFTFGCSQSKVKPIVQQPDEKKTEEPTPSPTERFEHLMADFQREAEDVFTRKNQADSEEARQQIGSGLPDLGTVLAKGLKFFEGHEQDPGFIDPIKLMVTNAPMQPELNDALLKLAEHHADNEQIAEVCLDVRNLFKAVQPESTLTFLRNVAQKSSVSNIQAAAMLAQASVLNEETDQERMIQLLQSVKESSQDVVVAGVNLGEDAAIRLFHVTTLGIGQVAPEIEGTDVEGSLFRLADYRGKVVMVSFWADW